MARREPTTRNLRGSGGKRSAGSKGASSGSKTGTGGSKRPPRTSQGTTGGRRSRRTSTRRWVWVGRLVAVAFFVGTFGLLALVGLLAYYARDLPTIEAVRNYSPPQTTRVLDRKGRLVGQFAQERRTVVPLERVPRVLVLSVLAAEDSDFYRHAGVDYTGIARAVWRDLVRGSRQGASTITQQIVKNLLLSPERTIARKVKEWILAIRIERELSKDEILFLYLNHINFGHGRYGVQEAARYYFDKDVADLDLGEASLLAGIPQAPARLSPITHPEASRRRQMYVLGQLERKRDEYWPDLPPQAIEEAREAPVKLASRKSSELDGAPELLSYVRKTLRDLVGDEAVAQGGYTIHTTLDLELQTQARRALRQGLESIDERQGLRAPRKAPRRRPAIEKLSTLTEGRSYDAVVVGSDDDRGVLELDVAGHRALASIQLGGRFNPKRLPPSRFAEKGARLRVSVESLARGGKPAQVRLELGPEAAAVVIDPRSRDVLAVVGSYEESFGFNRAMQAIRQPGSTFKPLVYGQALRSRQFTPASQVLDAPEVYEQWRPSNYETWHYEGAVRLREALARSINLVAVRVMSEVTPPAVIELARSLGITTKLEPNLSLALGSNDVRPIELTNAYATFAAGGRWEPYRLIRRIEDAAGNPVPLPTHQPGRDVMSPAEAYLLTSMLTSVVQHGTGAAAKRLGRPAAGKTGTSNDARDAWFVGYTPNTVAGVWVGYDDRRPLGRRESGARTALPIWIDVVQAAEKGQPKVDFVRPSGLESALIDPATGLLAYDGMEGAIEEVFLDGTVPTQFTRRPDELDANSFVMEQLNELGPHIEDIPPAGNQPQPTIEKKPLPLEHLLKDPS